MDDYRNFLAEAGLLARAIHRYGHHKHDLPLKVVTAFEEGYANNAPGEPDIEAIQKEAALCVVEQLEQRLYSIDLWPNDTLREYEQKIEELRESI